MIALHLCMERETKQNCRISIKIRNFCCDLKKI